MAEQSELLAEQSDVTQPPQTLIFNNNDNYNNNEEIKDDNEMTTTAGTTTTTTINFKSKGKRDSIRKRMDTTDRFKMAQDDLKKIASQNLERRDNWIRQNSRKAVGYGNDEYVGSADYNYNDDDYNNSELKQEEEDDSLLDGGNTPYGFKMSIDEDPTQKK
eukprot:16820_1